jgi:hypothetical protein
LAEILDPMSLLYYLVYTIFNFVIGVIVVKIEYDYYSCERSLNPYQPHQRLILVHSSSSTHHYLHSHHPTRPRLRTATPNAPLPSAEGCGSFRSGSMEGSRGEENNKGVPTRWEALAVRRETEHDESRVPFRALFSFNYHR